MNHYDLLGLSPEASDGDVREALEASRASWERRRDAAADAESRSRAEGALRRLAEAERDLLEPLDLMPPIEHAAEAERAIRAEAERRRESARQEAERSQREAAENPPADEVLPGRKAPERTRPNEVPGAEGLRVGKRTPRHDNKFRKSEREAQRRRRTLLILATTAGIGIAGAPVALVALKGSWPWQTTSSSAAPDVFRMRGGHGAPVEVVLAPSPLAEPAPIAAATTAPHPPQGTADLLRMGYAAYTARRYKEALAINDQVLSRTPSDPITRVHRAITFLALNRFREAEIECRIAIRILPAFPEAHYNLGVALHRQGRNADATLAFKKFVEIAPNDRAAPAARGFMAREILGPKRIGGAWVAPASGSNQ